MNIGKTLSLVLIALIFNSCSNFKKENNYKKTEKPFWTDSIAREHYSNRNDSTTWDKEMFEFELQYDTIPSIDPIKYGVFPVPKYELVKKGSFKGLGVTGTKKELKDKILQYTGFFVKKNELNKEDLRDRKNEVFFTILSLTDTIGENLKSAQNISRNHPNYIGEGTIINKKNRVDFVAFKTVDNHSYAIVNMRLFNLKYGNTILIAPQKDNSFRSKQIDLGKIEYQILEEKVDSLLKEEEVTEFFLSESNI